MCYTRIVAKVPSLKRLAPGRSYHSGLQWQATQMEALQSIIKSMPSLNNSTPRNFISHLRPTLCSLFNEITCIIITELLNFSNTLYQIALIGGLIISKYVPVTIELELHSIL